MIIRLDRTNPFNLDFTICCGQTFRWKKDQQWWYRTLGENVVKIRQDRSVLEFEGAKTSFIENYFRLDDNLTDIFSLINKDSTIQAAIKEFNGLRILRQEPWECLISFICATYKNIPAIEQMLNNLTERFGEKTCMDNKVLHTFPKPAKLAKADVNDLKSCGLGYRAKYVSETAKLVCKKVFNPNALIQQPSEKAKKLLMNLPGVGPKVADCILLFSLQKLEAFPIDLWIKRAILNHYQSHFSNEFLRRISTEQSLSNSTYKKLNSFGRQYFGKYAGYAQQYLYHYERTQEQVNHAHTGTKTTAHLFE